VGVSVGKPGLQAGYSRGLSGRYHSGWDERMRPMPANSRLVPVGGGAKIERGILLYSYA